MQIDSVEEINVLQENSELGMLKDFWLQFCQQMKQISDVFLYLERTYLISAQNMNFINAQPDEIELSTFRNLSPVGHSSFW